MSEELETVKSLMEGVSSDVQSLTKAVSTLVEMNQTEALKKAQEAEIQQKADAESAMFKRFVKMLKDAGVVFKGVPTAHATQTGASPEKAPEAQQAVIQGQVDPEEEEEYPAKAEEPEEEEEEKKAEAPEASALQKENSELKAQLKTLQNSIPEQVEKAVNERMQGMNWKSIGQTPVKLAGAGADEVTILKSDQPVTKDELMTQLNKMPLAQLNDMHMKVKAGILQMPEVV